ncbi:MAG: diguanylate cyclase [Sinimarinibacterium sp.]|jgi:diguanylate cyclase (GGDEF)-like protein/hemerythrin-like metal-binding protein
MDALSEVRELIERLPLPAVLLGKDATVAVENVRARQRISSEWLAINARSLMGLGRGSQSQIFEVPDPGSVSRKLTAHATPVRDGTVIVFDDSLEGASEEARGLHKRIAELEHQRTSDRLTSLWNRQHFDEVVIRETVFADQQCMPLSLLILDLDHFKLVNDRHGHAVGDRVLKATAERLRTACRPTDQLFRWGGEEFAMLVPATGRNAALRLADRLRLTMSSAPFESVGSQTVSVGVAEYLPQEAPEHWFERAEAALSRAKQLGRDRVEAAEGCAQRTVPQETGPSALRLVWSPQYMSGNSRIDDEHRALFETGNELIAAMSDSAIGQPATRAKVDAVLVAIARHFVDEEEILAQARYPELDRHKRVHAELLGAARKLHDAVRDGTSSAGEVIEFIAYEIINRHILKTDRAYFPFVDGLDSIPLSPSMGERAG